MVRLESKSKNTARKYKMIKLSQRFWVNIREKQIVDQSIKYGNHLQKETVVSPLIEGLPDEAGS